MVIRIKEENVRRIENDNGRHMTGVRFNTKNRRKHAFDYTFKFYYLKKFR